MIPGPTIIISCPHCGQSAKKQTLISFNTFGAQLWSDAKQIAPMKPESPGLVICKKCDQFYWVKDAKKVEEVSNHSEQKNKWSDAQFIEFPTFHQYFKALETISNERYIRIRIWWSYNDFFRNGHENKITSDMLDQNTKNLLTLLKLLNESDENDLLMKAEILRSLGWFEESKQLLDRIKDTNLSEIKNKFLVEINKQNIQVFQLF